MPSECGGSCCGAGKSDRATGVRHLPNWVLATNRNPINSTSTSVFTQYRYTRFPLAALYINDSSRGVCIFLVHGRRPEVALPVSSFGNAEDKRGDLDHSTSRDLIPQGQAPSVLASTNIRIFSPGTNYGRHEFSKPTTSSLSPPATRIRRRSPLSNNVASRFHAILVQRTLHLNLRLTQELRRDRRRTVSYTHLTLPTKRIV